MKKFSLLLLSLLMQVAVINTAYAQIDEYEYHLSESYGVRSAITNLPDGLSGQGVLVGIIDNGIDFNHINFLDPKTFQTRVKFASTFGDGDNYNEARTPEAIAKLIPYNTQDHGTHVAGIAAGSYAADGWHGIAPEANLLLADMRGQVVSSLEKIFAAADSLDMPLVVNISYEPDIVDGYNPAVLLCEKLTDNGKKPGRIIVASTGNEGNLRAYSEATIGEEGKVRFIMDTSVSGEDAYALESNFSFKAPKEASLSFRFFLYDNFAQKEVTEGITDLSGSPVDPTSFFKLSVNADNPSPYTYYGLVKHFKVDSSSDIVPCIEITGAKGTELRYIRHLVISDDDYFSPFNLFYGQPNALAMTPAVISVGNCDSHQEGWPIRKVSSFGFNKYGDKFPDVVAPGTGIISSGRYEYFPKSKNYNTYAQRDIKIADGSTKTFNWCTLIGTSQSSPLVAGLVALMLQYDKTLTTERVRELLHSTNDWTDACDKAPKGPEQAGHGILNTKALFEKLMGETSIKEVSASPADNAIYDLFGRRLSDIPAQGIYIRNGKKVVKK